MAGEKHQAVARTRSLILRVPPHALVSQMDHVGIVPSTRN